jgi:hypothetical protein
MMIPIFISAAALCVAVPQVIANVKAVRASEAVQPAVKSENCWIF